VKKDPSTDAMVKSGSKSNIQTSGSSANLTEKEKKGSSKDKKKEEDKEGSKGEGTRKSFTREIAYPRDCRLDSLGSASSLTWCFCLDFRLTLI
jgi:hypothetical protein